MEADKQGVSPYDMDREDQGRGGADHRRLRKRRGMRRLLSFLNLICTTVLPRTRRPRGRALRPERRAGPQDRAAVGAGYRSGWRASTSPSKGRGTSIAPPYLLMSNHQSALDITTLLSGLPVPFKFIAKRELFRIPLFGWAIKRAGYISIDRRTPGRPSRP